MTERDSAGDERGAVAVLSVFMAVFLVALLFWMISIGSALLYRERMQEAADAAVFSSAVMHARGMNLIALINIVMSGLLAVLVAFKLLESLVTLGIVACVACLVAGLGVCPPAAALPELIQLREHIREVQQTVKPAVVSGLSMLHAGARGVRAFMPHASQLTAAATVLEHYHPPAELALVTVPRDTLPTRDDAYSVLCHHAGELAASLALEPLPFLKGVVRREVKHAVADLVESDPDWFCAADDAHRGPPTSKYHYDAGVPPLPSEQKCFDSATTDAAKDACAAAAKDGEHAAPDPITGECGAGCDHELYDARARRARSDCNPRHHIGRFDYRWQERTVVKHYVMQGGAHGVLVPQPQDDEVGPSRLMKGKLAPCTAESWNATEDLSVPVCAPVVGGAGTTRQTVLEVQQVLGCHAKAVRETKVEDLSKDPTLGAHDAKDTSKSSQTMLDGLALGDETFQLRALVLGGPPHTYEPRVRMAAWGQSKPPDLSSESALERIQVAQAEYYFAGASRDARAWLWSMDWKARLRRFRCPSSEVCASKVMRVLSDRVIH